MTFSDFAELVLLVGASMVGLSIWMILCGALPSAPSLPGSSILNKTTHGNLKRDESDPKLAFGGLFGVMKKMVKTGIVLLIIGSILYLVSQVTS
jgi:hypothetical protein